ncbi:MAG: NADH-quinone oxidoreductase subunit J [Betaproteobacteria bacterium]|nr:NADH-quinone oxidoreductase subunit J [Betaproteobacteria bacterium]
MEFKTALFYILSAILVLAALRVVTARNPVHAVLFLVLAFFNASGLWLLLQAEFLAIALIVVYVGAVMVLFLFVVMMLDINLERLRQGFWNNLWLGGPIALLMVAEMIAVLSARSFGPEAMPAPAAAAGSNTKALGVAIYTDYVYPFELASVILLVALIAAVALNLRKRKDTKQLDPARQIAVKRKDRVRIVSMPSEKE